MYTWFPVVKGRLIFPYNDVEDCVLITDPHDIKDPLSDALIALSARVGELEKCLSLVDTQTQVPEPFATEAAEREAYREELDRLQEYVEMGEGI